MALSDGFSGKRWRDTIGGGEPEGVCIDVHASLPAANWSGELSSSCGTGHSKKNGRIQIICFENLLLSTPIATASHEPL
jgi:hypothetical protein